MCKRKKNLLEKKITDDVMISGMVYDKRCSGENKTCASAAGNKFFSWITKLSRSFFFSYCNKVKAMMRCRCLCIRRRSYSNV